MLDKIFMLDKKLNKQVLNNGKLEMLLLQLLVMVLIKLYNQRNKINKQDQLFIQWMLILLLVMLNFQSKEIYKILQLLEDLDFYKTLQQLLIALMYHPLLQLVQPQLIVLKQVLLLHAQPQRKLKLTINQIVDL